MSGPHAPRTDRCLGERQTSMLQITARDRRRQVQLGVVPKPITLADLEPQRPITCADLETRRPVTLADIERPRSARILT